MAAESSRRLAAGYMYRSNDSTRSLTRAIRLGDSEAFALFYRRWFDVVYEHARQFTGRDESFCLDVVQDVFMRAMRSIPELATDRSAHAWLKTVVVSCARDRIRRDRAIAARETASGETGPHRVPALLHEDHSTAEQLASLRALLATFEEPTRTALLMRFRFGRTLAQIGQLLGLSTGAVDGRLNRAIAALRRASEVDDA